MALAKKMTPVAPSPLVAGGTHPLTGNPLDEDARAGVSFRYGYAYPLAHAGPPIAYANYGNSTPVPLRQFGPLGQETRGSSQGSCYARVGRFVAPLVFCEDLHLSARIKEDGEESFSLSLRAEMNAGGALSDWVTDRLKAVPAFTPQGNYASMHLSMANLYAGLMVYSSVVSVLMHETGDYLNWKTICALHGQSF